MTGGILGDTFRWLGSCCMKLKEPRCPNCRRTVPLEHTCVEPPFQCWACGQKLQVASGYDWLLAVVSLSLSLPWPPLLGMRGPALWLALLLGSIPLYFILRVASKFILAPRLERYQPNEQDFLTLFRK